MRLTGVGGKEVDIVRAGEKDKNRLGQCEEGEQDLKYDN